MAYNLSRHCEGIKRIVAAEKFRPFDKQAQDITDTEHLKYFIQWNNISFLFITAKDILLQLDQQPRSQGLSSSPLVGQVREE